MGSIWTIPLNEPFLDGLVGGLLQEPPERLAATTLLLPSRRACLAARDTFLRLVEGRPLLLPRLQPIGEPDEAELFLDPALALTLPPAVASLRRRLLLTRLLLARDATMTVEQAIRLAGDLTTLLDELQNEEIELDALEGLVPEAFAEHWQNVLRFLRLLGDAWPKLLAAQGLVEPSLRRRQLLDGVIHRWETSPPAAPIVAAGVTGTIPAVARLLRAVSRLPDGVLVVPGLDLGLDEVSWLSLGPTHPQYPLKRLLERLEIDRTAVGTWPFRTERGSPDARIGLWRAVTAAGPAGEPRAPLPPEALQGLSLLRAADVTGEALGIALRLRATLEVPGRTAMLVTPDRTLARRVAAELGRWDVVIDDSAGVPLDQSPPGTFLLLTAHLLTEAAIPSMMLAALEHPLARGGMEQGNFRRHVRALERACLRGPRPSGGLAGLARVIELETDATHWPVPIERAALLAWLHAILARSRPFRELAAGGAADLGSLLEAHLLFAEWLASDGDGDCGELWAKEAGREVQRFLTELREAEGIIEALPVTAYPALLAVLMGDRRVRLQHRAHPRLGILGQFESRLVTADLVVIGGLVEGVWPSGTEAGPWLNRAMRRELGMPLVEERIGVAAHDLVMAGGAPEVILSLAAKDNAGSPTIPSRWLASLEAMLRASDQQEALRPKAEWDAWSRQLDEPREPDWPHPAPAPAPRPPIALRPRELWATDVETLLRNPYAVYARRILRLRALDPLDADPGQAERGQIVHEALQRFVELHPGDLPPAAEIELLRVGRELFARHAHHPQVMAIWWPRFVRIAGWFVAVEVERRREIRRIRTELTGRWQVEGLPGGPISIRARADRVEVGHDGRLTLIDYKTGNAPRAKDVLLGLSPQLPIEGLIAVAGGFPDLPAGDPAALLYFQLKGGEPAGEASDAGGTRGGDLEKLLATARQGLETLLAHFDDPATAYIVRPRPEVAALHDDYEHLARIAEWRGVEEG